jgi:hypothetical protein
MERKVNDERGICFPNKGRFIGVSIAASAVLIVFLTALFLSSTTTVFSAMNDSFTANVTVSNAYPSVSAVLFNSTAASANITLTAATDNNLIMCNATITDSNGYQDVATSGSVNATFYHSSYGSLYGANDKNQRYTNTSCTFTGGSGTTVTALCIASFEHEAYNGTWNCTITAKDGAGATANASRTNDITELVGLSVLNDSIHYGTMANGASSASALGVNVTNEGNVKIDVQVKGLSDMNCTVLGNLGINNISFNTTSGAYSTMSANKLSTSFQNLDAFNLYQEGVAPFGEDQPATNNTWWTITIPNGVRGECNNTVVIHALKSAD